SPRRRLQLPAVALAVLAPRPATGAALALLELLLGPTDATLSGGFLFGVLYPADELVAGQGRDVIPGIERGGVRHQRSTQVRRQFMHHPTGHRRAAHMSIGVSGERAGGRVPLRDDTIVFLGLGVGLGTRLVAVGHCLQRPAVAVWILEEDEAAPWEHLDVAYINAAFG